MKKSLLFLFIFAPTFTHAATQCVMDYSSYNSGFSDSSYMTWKLSADENFRARVMCSNTAGTSYEVKDEITVDSSNHDNNIYCWTMLVKPFASKWIYKSSYRTLQLCWQYCSEDISEAPMSRATIISAFYQNPL